MFGDGGGRELAYVALSRTTRPTHIHMVADDLDQAAEDLRREWSSERRQRWILETDAPAPDGTTRHPHIAHRAKQSPRTARLRAERAALLATVPPDPTGMLRDAQQRAATIPRELDDRRAGTCRYAATAIGKAAHRVRVAEHNHEQARHRANAPHLGRSPRRSQQRTAQAWAEELAAARHQWSAVAGPTERQLIDALANAEHASSRLGAQRARQALDRASGHGI